MKMIFKKIVPALLVLTMLLTLASCTAKEEPKTGVEKATQTVENATQPAENAAPSLWDRADYEKDASFGSGAKEIRVQVTAEEKTVTFTIKTDKETLADALLEHKLVEGEDGAYGLYIKKVNGILADYDVDATYWSLSKGGEMLMTGASDTQIQNGDTFELVRTK